MESAGARLHASLFLMRTPASRALASPSMRYTITDQRDAAKKDGRVSGLTGTPPMTTVKMMMITVLERLFPVNRAVSERLVRRLVSSLRTSRSDHLTTAGMKRAIPIPFRARVAMIRRSGVDSPRLMRRSIAGDNLDEPFGSLRIHGIRQIWECRYLKIPDRQKGDSLIRNAPSEKECDYSESR